jgi:hypothetical protein
LGRKSLVRFRWLLQKNDKTKKYEWSEVPHYILTPNDMSVEREVRKQGFWQADKADGAEHVYMSCYWCGAVNDFSEHKVGADGFVYPCVVCRACEKHEFVFLGNWNRGERKEIHREQK